ncbi:MAG TPA: PilZ domain-containing protein, partial [Polyangiaceae bacterium]|nr:PilZ domain-containing protein [Polyangiaceae bacterium]
MSECDERRVQGIKRVPVATLVEICGNQPGVPAFEGRSLDVSGRGMHVRTTYVPKVGDPLICRFENQGREIVVEGVVAWRREGDTGGDFGIEFTALDSQSVDALRALCGVAPPEPTEEPVAEPDNALPAPEPCASGAKVRLHIDGLGSPMKANVRDGSRRRVKVGSQLQFLKVGRHLEIEDVTLGARLSARIDAVDVRVDPRTQIPELVVALRYDHVEDATPEPSVVDQAPEASPYPDSGDPAALQDAVVGSDDPEERAAREAEAEMLAEQTAAEQARLAVDRLGTAAQGAAQAARATSRVIARFGQSAAAHAGSLFKGAGKQLLDLKKQQPSAAKRQTALPTGAPRTFQKLRPQGGQRPAGAAAPAPAPRAAPGGAAPARSAEAPTPRRRSSRIAIIAGGLAVVGATAAYVLRDVDGPSATSALPPLAAAAPMNSAAAATPPAGVAKLQPTKPAAKAAEDAGGIIANVPLFGPTPMATMEPAPLVPELAPADEEAA